MGEFFVNNITTIYAYWTFILLIWGAAEGVSFWRIYGMVKPRGRGLRLKDRTQLAMVALMTLIAQVIYFVVVDKTSELIDFMLFSYVWMSALFSVVSIESAISIVHLKRKEQDG